MSGSQHKKAEKARRRAEREKARAAERRRNLMTGILVGFILIIGGVLVVLSTSNSDDVDLEALQSEALASASEAGAFDGSDAPSDAAAASDQPDAAATSDATDGPTDAQPTDAAVEPGVPVDSGLAPVIDERPLACDGTEPANAGDTRPQYPGGPAQVLEEGVDYSAVIQTTCGTVTIDLLASDAPETVNSFVFLAQEGFFDGLEMFRNATSISALQTGGGNQTNSWQIGYSLPDELTVAETEGYPAGSVAMANAGPNSGGSQFFFVYGDGFQAALESGGLGPTFAVFATVTDGMDVLEQIGDIAVDGETPTQRVYMESVTIQES
ncbi:MAG: peptidylprolyl isomerase [Euzebya sp.]